MASKSRNLIRLGGDPESDDYVEGPAVTPRMLLGLLQRLPEEFLDVHLTTQSHTCAFSGELEWGDYQGDLPWVKKGPWVNLE